MHQLDCPRRNATRATVTLLLPAVALAGLVMTGCAGSGAGSRPAAQPAANASDPATSLPALLPAGRYRAEVLELKVGPRLRELSLKMMTAMGQDPRWARAYVQEHAKKDPGKPLPYHPNLGMSRAEYDEFQALAEKQELGVTRTFPLTIERRGSTVRFRTADARHRGLNELEIDLATGRLTTPVATIDTPTPMAPDATIRNLGPWRGVEWHDESGDIEKLTGQSVTLSLGRTPQTGHVAVEYRLNVVNGGFPVRREVMNFRFPVR